MKMFYFNPETKMGYVNDTSGDGSVEGTILIGAIAFMFFSIALFSVIILPFLISAKFKTFLDAFLVKNSLFTLLAFVVVLAIRVFTVDLSRNLWIKIAWSVFILGAVLYFFLYVLNFSEYLMYFNMKNKIIGNVSITHVSNWVRKPFEWFDWLKEFLYPWLSSMKGYTLYIPASLEDLDVFLLLSELLVIVFKIIKIFLASAVLIIAFIIGTIPIALPYLAGMLTLMLLNNIIFIFKRNILRRY